MAIAEITVIPIGTAGTSLSNYVAGCQKILAQNDNIKYQLTPMGTILEGDLEDIFNTLKKLHQVPFDRGAMRVVSNIKIDDRRDKNASMEQKLNSVKSKL